MMGEGTYAVALEPTTNRDAGRFDAKGRGELQWLQPSEERSYRLEVGVLEGAEAISAFEDRINSIELSSSRSAGEGPQQSADAAVVIEPAHAARSEEVS
jgi:hypothetical protein